MHDQQLAGGANSEQVHHLPPLLRRHFRRPRFDGVEPARFFEDCALHIQNGSYPLGSEISLFAS